MASVHQTVDVQASTTGATLAVASHVLLQLLLQVVEAEETHHVDQKDRHVMLQLEHAVVVSHAVGGYVQTVEETELAVMVFATGQLEKTAQVQARAAQTVAHNQTAPLEMEQEFVEEAVVAVVVETMMTVVVDHAQAELSEEKYSGIETEMALWIQGLKQTAQE